LQREEMGIEPGIQPRQPKSLRTLNDHGRIQKLSQMNPSKTNMNNKDANEIQ